MSAIKLDEKLWEEAKDYVMKDGKKWNARKAQQAVKYYKINGGRYSKKIPQNKTSLNKWTKEDWDYIDKKKSKRYLPKKVINHLTSKEKKEAMKKKKKLGTRIKYPKSVIKKMKDNDII